MTFWGFIGGMIEVTLLLFGTFLIAFIGFVIGGFLIMGFESLWDKMVDLLHLPESWKISLL